METALVAILDDLWYGCVGGCASILTLLDLLAVFGTIDHGTPLDCLKRLGESGMMYC